MGPAAPVRRSAKRLPPASKAAEAAVALAALNPREVQTARLAIAMGYYESPRRCTMEDIARELGITKSAVYHRMSKVERTALTTLLGDVGEPA